MNTMTSSYSYSVFPVAKGCVNLQRHKMTGSLHCLGCLQKVFASFQNTVSSAVYPSSKAHTCSVVLAAQQPNKLSLPSNPSGLVIHVLKRSDPRGLTVSTYKHLSDDNSCLKLIILMNIYNTYTYIIHIHTYNMYIL